MYVLQITPHHFKQALAHQHTLDKCQSSYPSHSTQYDDTSNEILPYKQYCRWEDTIVKSDGKQCLAHNHNSQTSQYVCT